MIKSIPDLKATIHRLDSRIEKMRKGDIARTSVMAARDASQQKLDYLLEQETGGLGLKLHCDLRLNGSTAGYLQALINVPTVKIAAEKIAKDLVYKARSRKELFAQRFGCLLGVALTEFEKGDTQEFLLDAIVLSLTLTEEANRQCYKPRKKVNKSF